MAEDFETILDASHKDHALGDFVCEWTIDVPLSLFKELFSEILDLLIDEMKAAGLKETTTESHLDHEREVAAAEFQSLLSKLAPGYFIEAKARLVLDLSFQVLRDHKFTFVSQSDGEISMISPADIWGRDFVKAVNENRDLGVPEIRKLLRALLGVRPGRPADPVNDEIATYYGKILEEIRKAKKEISRYGVALEWLQAEAGFEELSRHQDLMKRLFDKGRESEPSRLAREYTLRKFQLNMSENALEVKLRRRKNVKKEG